MKWRIPKKPKLPYIGTMRYTTKYAWWPTEVKSNSGGEYYIWFEWYTLIEQYNRGDRWDYDGNPVHYWETINKTIA
jgi:hypothetical protein